MELSDVSPSDGGVLANALQQVMVTATEQSQQATQNAYHAHREPAQSPVVGDADEVADVVHLAGEVTAKLFRLIDPPPLGGVRNLAAASRLLRHRGVLPAALDDALAEVIDLGDRASLNENVPRHLQDVARATGPTILQQLDDLYANRFVSIEQHVIREVETISPRRGYAIEVDYNPGCREAADAKIEHNNHRLIIECRPRLGCADRDICKAAFKETAAWLGCMPQRDPILLILPVCEGLEPDIKALVEIRGNLNVLSWDQDANTLDRRIRKLLASTPSASSPNSKLPGTQMQDATRVVDVSRRSDQSM